MAERNRDTEFGILGALVLALILGLLCKFCVICPCSNCGEGMSYDEQSKLCCDKDKQLCCPSGSRPCDQLQGCSELQLGCQSGCCTDKCECLMPPPGKNVTWTACRDGYSDCNFDGEWDCNTTNSSAVCFGGACNTAAVSAPLEGTCLEGWSDCDNNASTGIILERGIGCECNTGARLTCCGSQCVNTSCRNPIDGCNLTNTCCPGFGCVTPPGNSTGECKPCSNFSGTDCGSCPRGCGFNVTSKNCTSCVNPVTCGIDECCCGYECNTSTSKCDPVYHCENPPAGDCPVVSCCPNYGCLNNRCEPCSNFSGEDCGSCPTGCGFNVTSKNCTSCKNPESCGSDGDCCCGFLCNPYTNKCGINPPCKSAFQTCSNSSECCSDNCKSLVVVGNQVDLCCYECEASECCDENGNPLDTYCPELCSDGGCKVECGSDGKCPIESKCCRNSNECSVCTNDLCGGIGPRVCNKLLHGNADCLGSTCSGGVCNGGGGNGDDDGEDGGCTNNDQCSICNLFNLQCGGRGLECSEDSNCSSSLCSGGACCPAGATWNAGNICCWDSARECCVNSIGTCVGTCSLGTVQACMTTDGCTGTKTCTQAGTFGECVKQDPQCGTIDCGFTGTLGQCIPVLDQFCDGDCVASGTKCTDPRYGAGTCKKTGAICTVGGSTECCCDLNCQLIGSLGGIGVCCAGGIWECTPN